LDIVVIVEFKLSFFEFELCDFGGKLNVIFLCEQPQLSFVAFIWLIKASLYRNKFILLLYFRGAYAIFLWEIKGTFQV
jgi:hypothetical protein